MPNARSAHTWRVLVCPASFKGSLTAGAAGEAIRRGLARIWPAAEVKVVGLADGGEGTVEALLAATGGRPAVARVTGPLGQETVQATWAVLDNGTSVVEMAQAAGLPLVPVSRRDPMLTTTAGVGELIREALGSGARKILVGLGGSATVDGGLGAMRALGAALLDIQGRPVPPGGRGLGALDRIDPTGLDPRLSGVELLTLADVTNPLLGEEGAARVFGPQKGADAATVDLLERGLENLARIAGRDLGLSYDLGLLPGGGAAGGLGAALAAFCRAPIISGIDYVMEACGLAEKIAWADLVITGEGQLDGQSRRGKACSGVARLAAAAGRPVVAVVGAVRSEDEAVRGLGLQGVLPAASGPMTLIEAMDGAAGNLEAAAARLARLLTVGYGLPGSPA
jgi:glycerate kinase